MRLAYAGQLMITYYCCCARCTCCIECGALADWDQDKAAGMLMRSTYPLQEWLIRHGNFQNPMSGGSAGMLGIIAG